jgi:hypothetical protein
MLLAMAERRLGLADKLAQGTLIERSVIRQLADSRKIQSLTRRLRVTKNVLLCLRREFARVLEN